MNFKALLTLIVAIIFMFLAQWWYGNKVSGCCEHNNTETVAPIPTEKDPLMFKWSDATPFTYDKFAAYKKSILEGKTNDNTLVITGKYFEGETPPAGYANMGLARAAEIRKLFPSVPDTRIELAAEKVSSSSIQDMKTNEFTSAAFNWKAASKEEKTVIELANKALIYFPYRSKQKEVDATVDAYLKRLAKRLNSGTEKVIITGHTDDRGDEAANMRLGASRSKTVRDILVGLGVDSKKITTLSKGETEPAEPNGTERGWRMNRRTVVEVVQ